MTLKELFKNATLDLTGLRLFDSNGIERATFEKHENGLIFYFKDVEKFFDEYKIQLDLPEEISEELIGFINLI